MRRIRQHSGRTRKATRASYTALQIWAVDSGMICVMKHIYGIWSQNMLLNAN